LVSSGRNIPVKAQILKAFKELYGYWIYDEEYSRNMSKIEVAG